MDDLGTAVAELGEIRTRYGGAYAGRRRRLLQAASRCPIDDAAVLVTYHELLLFLCAFPDDVKTLAQTQRELRRVRAAAVRLMRQGRRADCGKLDDSGIAGTITHCQFSLLKATWLAERYPRDTEIAWEDESAGDGVETMLAALVEPIETNGLDDTTLSTRAWFRLARGAVGSKRETDLAWLLRHFARLDLRPIVRDKVFDLTELTIRWRLAVNSASRTFARTPLRKLRYQKTPLGRTVDAMQVITQPVAPVRRRAGAQALGLIDIARSVLAVRQRETDPVTYASPQDVTAFDLGGGIDVILYGHVAGQRTPIETYYGFLVAKNRVPIGYGGGWVFCGRCEIGVNIFDTFRGGESMNTFAQLLRLYRDHFDIERFTVDPYQVGAGNPEAIKSGAYWFYYRFGFRSVDAAMRDAAEREWARLVRVPRERTPARLLRKLAAHPLELVIEPVKRRELFEPVELSLGITRWIGSRFHGEREAARRWSVRKVRHALGQPDQSRWSDAEITAFDDLCLTVAPIPDLGRWTHEEKSRLVQLMRAKGGPRERVYAARLKQHGRLRAAWKNIVAKRS